MKTLKKSLIILSLFMLISLKVMAQTPIPVKIKTYEIREQLYERRNTCQPIVALKITSAANQLIESYRKLFKDKNKLCKGPNGILTSFGLMSQKYYCDSQTGEVSFASYYEREDIFRTIWGQSKAQFDYYGVCAPNPIVWTNPVGSQNHIWELKFVTISNYSKNPDPKNYSGFLGVPISDIRSINCIKIEETNGFVAKTEPELYANTYSSKGILAYITLLNNTLELCYIVNNYDSSKNLTWKK